MMDMKVMISASLLTLALLVEYVSRQNLKINGLMIRITG